MIADSEVANKVSRVLQTGNLIFGIPAVKGNADRNCVIAATTGLFVGLVVMDTTLLHATPDRYEAGDNVALMDKGVMWVTAGGTITPASVVSWDPADPTAGWKASATGFLPIPGAKFLDSGVDGDIVRVRLADDGFLAVLTAAA